MHPNFSTLRCILISYNLASIEKVGKVTAVGWSSWCHSIVRYRQTINSRQYYYGHVLFTVVCDDSIFKRVVVIAHTIRVLTADP